MAVSRPIEVSLAAQPHPAYYLMHKYWARKPHNIVRAYIEHFTEPGDLVLDPFSGSGVTLVEALLSGRRAIAVDINPAASLISEATVLPFDIDQVQDVFADLKRAVRPEIDRLFTTRCPDCSHRSAITHVVWENCAPCPKCEVELRLGSVEKVKRKYVCPNCKEDTYIPSKLIRDERMVEVWLTCPRCGDGTVKRKAPDAADLALLEACARDARRLPPEHARMFLSNRTLVYEGMSVESFFTPRNRHSLCLLADAVRSIRDDQIRRLFQLVFTGSVAQSSRLIPYRNRLTTGGPAWTISGFWVPNLHLEINAWNCFAARFQKVVRGKSLLHSKMAANPYHPASAFEDLEGQANAWIITHTATELSHLIPDNSVDYIFTDPPYGDSVPYLEYGILWFSWLGLSADYENEIIISDSHERTKDLSDYHRLLTKALSECHRVLKPGSWLSLTFHNRRLDVWDAVASAAASAGLQLVNCLYQVPAVVPAKAQLSRDGSVVGDIVLNFKKPLHKASGRQQEGLQHASGVILSEAERIIAERGGEATTDEITRGVVIALLKRGGAGMVSQDVVNTLRTRFCERGSRWSFRDDEQHLVSRYEQLRDVVSRVVRGCIAAGITDVRDVIAHVMSELRDGREPDISVILDEYEQAAPPPQQGQHDDRQPSLPWQE